MKRMLLLPILIAILFAGFLPQNVRAATLAETNSKVAPPGAVMAQAVSTVTGVAISPLLGASAVGAWKYFATPKAEREKLPWYARPWFWIPAFLIVGLCALKDTFGMSVPAILKKPFDVLEVIAHKTSGLIALGVFVPMVASVFHAAGMVPPGGLDAMNGHGFLAVIQPSTLYNGIAIAISVFVFIIVFFASNSINILILLSPFPVFDAFLKLFRLAVLITVAGTSLLNPWFGLVWSLIIIVIAYCIAGWSFRLSHFGAVFVWDFCTFRRNHFYPDKTENAMFLGRTINKVPIRTAGKLSRDAQGNFVFKYRPWLVLPQRTLQMPPGIYAVSKGLIYSEIVKHEGGKSRIALLLPPRYRTHEDALAAIYGMGAVEHGGLLAMFDWIKDHLWFKSKPQVIEV